MSAIDDFLANNDDYYPDVIPVCPVDGSSYTIDPTTHRVSGYEDDCTD